MLLVLREAGLRLNDIVTHVIDIDGEIYFPEADCIKKYISYDYSLKKQKYQAFFKNMYYSCPPILYKNYDTLPSTSVWC